MPWTSRCFVKVSISIGNIEHYVALEPRQNPTVIGCQANPAARTRPSKLPDQYEAVLVPDGWRIFERVDQDPSATLVPAPPADGPLPDEMPALRNSLHAERDGYRIFIDCTRSWAGLSQPDGRVDSREISWVMVAVHPSTNEFGPWSREPDTPIPIGKRSFIAR